METGQLRQKINQLEEVSKIPEVIDNGDQGYPQYPRFIYTDPYSRNRADSARRELVHLYRSLTPQQRTELSLSHFQLFSKKHPQIRTAIDFSVALPFCVGAIFGIKYLFEQMLD